MRRAVEREVEGTQEKRKQEVSKDDVCELAFVVGSSIQALAFWSGEALCSSSSDDWSTAKQHVLDVSSSTGDLIPSYQPTAMGAVTQKPIQPNCLGVIL